MKGPAAVPGQRQLELGHRGLGTAVSMQAPGPTPPRPPSISSSLAVLAGRTLSLRRVPSPGASDPGLRVPDPAAGSRAGGAEQPGQPTPCSWCLSPSLALPVFMPILFPLPITSLSPEGCVCSDLVFWWAQSWCESTRRNQQEQAAAGGFACSGVFAVERPVCSGPRSSSLQPVTHLASKLLVGHCVEAMWVPR